MCEITLKQDKIRIIIDEIFRIVIFNMYIAHNILHLVNYTFLWICYKQKINLRSTDAQGLPARASLRLAILTVGGPGVEGGGLFLGDLLHLAEHLAGGGLVELDLVGQSAGPDGVQQPECAHRVHIGCVLRQLKGHLQTKSNLLI